MEEHRLKVFQKRVLRRVFGPKRDEVMGWWRKLYNEELHTLYSPPSSGKVKEEEMGRACIEMGEKRNVYRILLRKPEGKRPLGRQRRR
jgi:hypothetical protein